MTWSEDLLTDRLIKQYDRVFIERHENENQYYLITQSTSVIFVDFFRSVLSDVFTLLVIFWGGQLNHNVPLKILLIPNSQVSKAFPSFKSPFYCKTLTKKGI